MFSSLIEKTKDSVLVRSIIVFIVMIVLFMLVAVKLFKLQVVDDKKPSETEMQQMSKIDKEKSEAEAGYKYVTEYVLPGRGNIYDKSGNLLAYNVQEYNLYLINSASLKNNAERNEAMLALSKLLKDYGYETDLSFPLIVDESGRLS